MKRFHREPLCGRLDDPNESHPALVELDCGIHRSECRVAYNDPIHRVPGTGQFEDGRCAGRLLRLVVVVVGLVAWLVVVIVLALCLGLGGALAFTLCLTEAKLAKDVSAGVAGSLYLAPIICLPVHGNVVGKPNGYL